jgi:NAD+ diphosphatase
MKHCIECGTKLVEKELDHEGLVPFCPTCDTFRFPIFNTAVSTVIMNKERSKILFIQQYGRPGYILTAGYVNKGETAEETLIREVKEEIGVNVTDFVYNKSFYWERSNTLIFNYISVVDSEDLSGTNHEIDVATWFPVDEAAANVKPDSLAEKFLTAALPKIKSNCI